MARLTADLVSLIPALTVAFVIIMGSVVVIAGWKSFRDRPPSRRQRGVLYAPGQEHEGAL